MVRSKWMRRKMETEESHERFAGNLLRTNRGRRWGRDSSLHAQRAGSPLVRRSHICFLPDNWPRFLVALHVLVGCAGGWGPDSAPLASVVWPGVHGVRGMDVQDMATRPGDDRRGPALVEGDQVLH